MRRADRLFQIVQLLRTRRLLTAADLARELGVSVRTVYRDVSDLQANDVPIRGEAGVGYALERGFELPPLAFTTEELEALVLGARMVQAWGDEGLANAARAALVKVEGAIPSTLRKAFVQTPLYAPTFTRDTSVPPHLASLRAAIAAGRALRFGYTSGDGERTERTVRPAGLFFWGARWTLGGWCELRSGWRTFRVDRLADLQVMHVLDADDVVDVQAFLHHVRG